MPFTCVVCGYTSECSKENENKTYTAFHRFPLKDERHLEKWENIVKRARNDGQQWRATRHSYICSNHFEACDYTILPSSTGPCRLKKYAVPSLFKLEFKPQSIPKEARSRLEMPEGSSTHQGHKRPISCEHLLSTIYHDHCYGKRQKLIQQTPLQEIHGNSCQDEEISKKQLKHKIKNLQQQLRRCKKKIGNMAELIDKLQEELIIKSDVADKLHASFDKIQLSIFQNVQKNSQSLPCGRRYTDDIKEFALTLYFYSPKAYQYVRSILPLPNPSLIRKWASSVDCEPGFLKEAFKALSDEVKQCLDKKDCYLIMDAMSIRKETVWDKKNDRYDGFINYGTVNPEDPETLASEALVFLLVGARTHWKCPIGYFLGNKIYARIQAQLLITALEMAAESGLRVWSITADGTSVNLSNNVQGHGYKVQASNRRLPCIRHIGFMPHVETGQKCTRNTSFIHRQ
ncbi:DNA transposase THAP9-like [Paramuricea clavata]|uniref:DNA transposase THAP9-like n=1 Tax=Paramuricea clavata TaxID=317549 RepID=A0A6S7IXM5_PARCT|nr:DNA transposase THAP9-like [Paramuricea clavata]